MSADYPIGTRSDECDGCGGWGAVSEVGGDLLCGGCADELTDNPWCVVESASGVVVRPGPLTSEQAKHMVRMHADALRYADAGKFWRAVRVADVTRNGAA